MQEQIVKWSGMVLPWILSHGVKILVIFVAALILSRFSKRFVQKVIESIMVRDAVRSGLTEKKREDTLVRIFAGVLKILIWVIAVLMIMQELGLMIGPILAGAGIAGLAVGFGGQYLIRDVIAGLFIIIENQYRIGDVVSLDDTGGLVEDISIRMTTIRDLDGTVHHIPHGEIKRVSNLTKYFSRVNLNVGVGYGSDLDHVISVVNQIGNEMASDPQWKEAIITAPQFLRVDDFGASSIAIKIVGDTQPIRQWDVTGELRKRIKLVFDKEGIEIPFPQRVIHQVAN